MAKAKFDKYYTPEQVINTCVSALSRVVEDKDILVIEPAAGDGRWLPVLHKHGFANTIGLDILPDGPKVKAFDFLIDDLSSDITSTSTLFVTNPPFGRACSLAIKFFNKAAEYNPHFIAFLIPKSFGKKFQARKRINHGYILHSIVELGKDHFERPDGIRYDGDESRLECEFQIWTKGKREKVLTPKPTGYKIVRPPNQKIIDREGILRELPVGQLDVDFTIVTHGTKAGTVEDFDPTTNKVSVRQFVKVLDGFDVQEVRRKFEVTDFSYFTKSSTIGSQGSISTDEIICCVEGIDFKLRTVI